MAIINLAFISIGEKSRKMKGEHVKPSTCNCLTAINIELVETEEIFRNTQTGFHCPVLSFFPFSSCLLSEIQIT